MTTKYSNHQPATRASQDPADAGPSPTSSAFSRPSAELLVQAARWHTLMQAPEVSDGERAAFTAWLEQAPEHAQAYQRMDTLWGELTQVFCE